MYQLIIKIASPGCKLKNNKESVFGHIWYSLKNEKGETHSFGFGLNTDHEGKLFAPGVVKTDDDDHYLKISYKKIIEINKEQYEKILGFGKNPKSDRFNFDLTFSATKNNCMNFTLKALEIAELNSEHNAIMKVYLKMIEEIQNWPNRFDSVGFENVIKEIKGVSELA